MAAERVDRFSANYSRDSNLGYSDPEPAVLRYPHASTGLNVFYRQALKGISGITRNHARKRESILKLY